MVDGTGKHCDLCDLPLAQCAHGFERRRTKGQRRLRKGAPPAEKPQRKVSGRNTGVASGEARMCAECGERARYGRYRLCLPRGISAGFRVCRVCGRYFRPQTPLRTKKKATCKTCNWVCPY